MLPVGSRALPCWLLLLLLPGGGAGCAGLAPRTTQGPRPLSAAEPIPVCVPAAWTVPERQMARTFLGRHAGHAVYSICTDQASWRLREEDRARRLQVDVWVRTQQARHCFAFRSTFQLDTPDAAPSWMGDAPGTLEMDCATSRPTTLARAPGAVSGQQPQVATRPAAQPAPNKVGRPTAPRKTATRTKKG